MSTENTSMKIVTPAGDSHSERKMIIDKEAFIKIHSLLLLAPCLDCMYWL